MKNLILSIPVSRSFLTTLGLLICLPLTSQASELDENTVARVNGQNLSLPMYEFLLGSRQREDQQSTEFALTEEEILESRAQSAEDLVLTEVLAQEALRLNVDQITMNKIEIELAYKTLLAQLMVRQIMADIKVTEDDIRAVYNAEKSASLYRFNLWAAPSKAEAEKLLANLKENKPLTHHYEKIETPWLDQLELEASVVPLVDMTSVGDFVSQVIEQDGLWKVVQIIDKNRFDKPPYDESREMIKAELIQNQVDEEIRKLSMNANIQINPLHVQ